ncbi:hypothetical protein [Terrarubrum flagellatum]|uniref:hypothetical protein n=1 Tax=Terrirubrum flagellatum TaxID=2895980 RepID=UPI003145448F
MDAVSQSSGLMVPKAQAAQDAILAAFSSDTNKIDPESIILNAPMQMMAAAHDNNVVLTQAALSSGIGQNVDTRA